MSTKYLGLMVTKADGAAQAEAAARSSRRLVGTMEFFHDFLHIRNHVYAQHNCTKSRSVQLGCVHSPRLCIDLSRRRRRWSRTLAGHSPMEKRRCLILSLMRPAASSKVRRVRGRLPRERHRRSGGFPGKSIPESRYPIASSLPALSGRLPHGGLVHSGKESGSQRRDFTRACGWDRESDQKPKVSKCRYLPDAVDQAVLNRLMDVVAHAPTRELSARSVSP